MTRTATILIAGALVIFVVVLGVYLSRSSRESAVPPPIAAEGSGVSAGQTPSVAALIADPNALQAATKACQDGTGADVMTLCDRVHSARTQILAQKYRQGGGK